MAKVRKANLDILRTLAAAAVAVYHVLANAAHSDPMASAQLVANTEALCAALYWHVPVFFMLTGYLWLGSHKECTYSTVMGNVRRFIIVLFTIGYGYAMMELVFAARTLSLSLLLAGLGNVIQGKLWAHMWYVYAIIGIYLFLPVLKPFFDHSSTKTISLAVGLLFLLGMLAPAVSESYGFAFPVSLPVSSSLFYVCAGALLAKTDAAVCKKLAAPAWLLFVLGMAAGFLSHRAAPDSSWVSLCNCISAVSLYTAVLGSFSAANSKPWLYAFADCSFGIYLFHQLFINIMFKVLHIYPFQMLPVVSIPAASAVIIGLSFAMTYLLRKIPLIKNYIL